MAGLNKVILIGRIGKDPETFIFDDGTKKISFSLATTESYRDRTTNEWKDTTEWHNIVGYRYLAEKNIAKGDLVYIEGKLKNRKYSDKDGNEKYVTEILSEKIHLLAKPHGTESSLPASDRVSNAKSDMQPASGDSSSAPTIEDDLPF